MTYPIFLSSLCRELRNFRAKIYSDIGDERYVYVDEKVKFRDIPNQDNLEATDELIRRVREADIMPEISLGAAGSTAPRNLGRAIAISTRGIDDVLTLTTDPAEIRPTALLERPMHARAHNLSVASSG